MRQHQRRGGVTSDDDEVRTVGLDQLVHERAYARNELGLAATAVRKESIVGDVDVARIGPHLGDLAKNGEAAEPGIKDENGGSHGGWWYEKNGCRAMSSRGARSGCGGCVLRKARRIATRCGLLRAISHHSPWRKIAEI